MPLIFNTTQRIRIVLDSDSNASPSPTFIFSNLTLNQNLEWTKFSDKVAKDSKSDDESVNDQDAVFAMFNNLLELLQGNLVGWENLPVEYNPAALGDTLTPDEAFEIFGKTLRATNLAPDDKKKCESQSCCNAESSALAAPVTLKNVTPPSQQTVAPASSAQSATDPAATIATTTDESTSSVVHQN